MGLIPWAVLIRGAELIPWAVLILGTELIPWAVLILGTELIPGAELIPQCSTSRNRMYSPFWGNLTDSLAGQQLFQY
jgi:hypothetical protein